MYRILVWLMAGLFIRNHTLVTRLTVKMSVIKNMQTFIEGIQAIGLLENRPLVPLYLLCFIVIIML